VQTKKYTKLIIINIIYVILYNQCHWCIGNEQTMTRC